MKTHSPEATALELAGVGAIIVSADRRCLRANSVVERWVSNRSTSDTLFTLRTQLDALDDTAFGKLLATAESGRMAKTVVQLTDSPTGPVSLEVSARPLEDGGGTLLLLEHAQTTQILTPSSTDGSGAASERLRQVLNRVVAFVGVLDLDGVLLEANEPALEAADLVAADVVGKPFWDCYWWSYDAATQARLRDAVRRAAAGETVRYDSEIRIGETARLTIDFQLAPLLNDDGTVTQLIPSAVDITERAATEAHRELLVHELSHRVKNTLANIRSIAANTLRGADSLDVFRLAFEGRLAAVSSCHELLMKTDHASAPLPQLVHSQLAPFIGRSAGALKVDGPAIRISGHAVLPIALVLHELATNAGKYGALASPSGQVTISWRRESPQGVRLSWREQGGPKVEPPTRRGFGSALIDESLSYSLGASCERTFPSEGVEAIFCIPGIDVTDQP